MDLRGWPWIRADRATAIVGGIDLALVTLVIGYGLRAHGTPPWEEPAHAVLTIAPFLAGWLVAGTMLGAYSRRAIEELRWGIAATGTAWAVATVIATALRASSFLPGSAPPAFVAVTMAGGWALLVPWRALRATYKRLLP